MRYRGSGIAVATPGLIDLWLVKYGLWLSKVWFSNVWLTTPQLTHLRLTNSEPFSPLVE